MLSELCDQELIASTKRLLKKEQEVLSEILNHLEEIEKRRLYSDFSCPSLFDYCVKHLGYSEAQAYRRIDAMRVLKKIPELKTSVKNGELTLSNLNLGSSFLRDVSIKERGKQKEILYSLIGQSKKESEQILNNLKFRENLISKKEQNEPKSNRTQKLTNDKTRVHLNLSDKTFEKLNRIQGLLGEADLDKVIEKLADRFIQDTTEIKRERVVTPKVSRSIPKIVKAKVYTKANGKCELCGSLSKLEYDHKTPFAKGGDNSLANIRLLCRSCNQRSAIKEFGLAKMSRYLQSTPSTFASEGDGITVDQIVKISS